MVEAIQHQLDSSTVKHAIRISDIKVHHPGGQVAALHNVGTASVVSNLVATNVQEWEEDFGKQLDNIINSANTRSRIKDIATDFVRPIIGMVGNSAVISVSHTAAFTAAYGIKAERNPLAICAENARQCGIIVFNRRTPDRKHDDCGQVVSWNNINFASKDSGPLAQGLG